MAEWVLITNNYQLSLDQIENLKFISNVTIYRLYYIQTLILILRLFLM